MNRSTSERQSNATRPPGEFESQLWPILCVVAAMGAVACALVVATCPFPNPLELDWLTVDAYLTGWGRLGAVVLMLGVAIGAVLLLQRFMARRILFCVLAGLLIHMLLGLYLHNQFLELLLQRELARSEQPGEEPAETALPDYHWRSVDQPETREDFETPIAAEQLRQTEKLELTPRTEADIPKLRPEQRAVEFEPTQPETAPRAIRREQIAETDPLEAMPAPRREQPNQRPEVKPTPIDIPEPSRAHSSNTTQLAPQEPAPVQRQSTHEAGSLPRATSPSIAAPRSSEAVAPTQTLSRLSDSNDSTAVPDSVTMPRLARTVPSFSRPQIAPTPPDLRNSVNTPAPVQSASGDAAPAYQMATVGTVSRRVSHFPSAESGAEPGRPTDMSNAVGTPGVSANGSPNVPQRSSGGSTDGDMIASLGAGTDSGSMARTSRATRLPGALAGAGVAGDVADLGVPNGSNQAGGDANVSDIADNGSADGTSPFSPGRRTGDIGWRAPGAPNETDAGASGTGGAGENTIGSATAASGDTPHIGSLAARTGGTDLGEITALGMASRMSIPRRSAAGIGRASIRPRIADLSNDAFAHRQPDIRKDLAMKHGGTPETERAVERALAYFARQQFPDGRWALDRFARGDSPDYVDASPGEMNADTAATGLALLAFLGAGYTHQEGQYRTVVRDGLQWLIANQGEDGRFYSEETDRTAFARTYGHGISAIAMCEAYGMTRDPALKASAEKAVAFIVSSQHAELGGWRYQPNYESDTSVSGWQLMALTSAKLAGLDVPQNTLDGVRHWLDLAQFYEGSQYAYNPYAKDDPTQVHGRDPNLPMTAEGLLMRLYLGSNRSEVRIRAGADFLQKNLPEMGTPGRSRRDLYYWYLATQVMFQMQDEHWTAWNERLRPLVLRDQVTQGELAGSWHPRRPVIDRWAREAGRHYVTAMHVLNLEIYYRYLPIYDMLDD